MPAGASLPISGENGKITMTKGATTKQGFFVGEWEISTEVKTKEYDGWIGNPTGGKRRAGMVTTFKFNGNISPTGEDADSDAFRTMIKDAVFADDPPDTLVFDTLLGDKYTFNKATTLWEKYTYKHSMKDGVSFDAEGSGVSVPGPGSAS